MYPGPNVIPTNTKNKNVFLFGIVRVFLKLKFFDVNNAPTVPAKLLANKNIHTELAVTVKYFCTTQIQIASNIDIAKNKYPFFTSCTVSD